MAHFNTLGHTFEDLPIMVIEELGLSPIERRKSGRYFGFTLLGWWPHKASIWKTNIIRDPRQAIQLVGMAFSTIPKEIRLMPFHNYLNKEDPTVFRQADEGKALIS